MPDIASLPPDYPAWLAELKTRIQTAQQRAGVGWACIPMPNAREATGNVGHEYMPNLRNLITNAVTGKIDVRDFVIPQEG